MNDNKFRPAPVTAVSSSQVTVTAEPNRKQDLPGGFFVRFMSNSTHTVFTGVFENPLANRVISMLEGTREKMLVDAVNNRTRERNYYRLYSRLLEKEISDEDFERIIDENPKDYMISTDKIPSETEFHEAIALSDHIMGVETSGDIESLFSFNGEEFNKYCKKLLDGSL